MGALELHRLKKAYGDCVSVDEVTLDFEDGRVHAVVGENGAGKTTLLRMAAGLVVPDSGEVRVFGERLSPPDARTAIDRGVGMVEQHFALVPSLTVLENVILGSEPTRAFGLVDRRVARERVGSVARELGIELDLERRVSEVGVGEKQRVEIVRALYRRAKILILDEPTAMLAHSEAVHLYATLRRLSDAGTLIIVVTHKLDEVLDFADHVSILRKGRKVHDEPVVRRAGARNREDDLRRLSEAIMGGAIVDKGRVHSRARSAAPRSASGLRIEALDSGSALRGFSLTIDAGEIVGIAGIEGNGQRELVAALSGLGAIDSGSVRVGDASSSSSSSSIATVHEDRHHEGLVLDATVGENLLLGQLERTTRFGVVDARKTRKIAEVRLAVGEVVPADLDRTARTLSGGNQQKIVVARAIGLFGDDETAPLEGKALVLSHPTRGVDLGASHGIWRRIRSFAERGGAVLVISSDLNELRELASRIHVLRAGKLVAQFEPSATDAEIGRAMIAERGTS